MCDAIEQVVLCNSEIGFHEENLYFCNSATVLLCFGAGSTDQGHRCYSQHWALLAILMAYTVSKLIKLAGC